MSDTPPPSLETRMLMNSLQQGGKYPFLRAAKWIIRVVAAIYVALGFILAFFLLDGAMSADTRDLIAWWGGPERGYGLVAAGLFTGGIALRTIILLALGEGIQLLLDVRREQADAAAAHADLAAVVVRPREN
jgi:hypothetical protein